MASDRSFTQGMALGIAASVTCIQLWFAVAFPAYRGMYREMGTATLPLATRIAIAPAWLWSVTLALVAAITWLAIKRPRSHAAYVACGVVAIAVVAWTYHSAQAPIGALASAIH